MMFNGLDAEQAAEFAERWLPAWTGNRPEYLAAFYTDDVFYSDPGIPDGVRGKAALLGYFQKLLARYPDWVWAQERSVPLLDGFLNFWKAEIPEADRRVTIHGVCMVQLHDGLIYRNEVYFDRLPWLSSERQ